jgi:hypothetical protein
MGRGKNPTLPDLVRFFRLLHLQYARVFRRKSEKR